ncbi:unnamed protein product, partial [Iphiclides podalirius]
MPSRACPTFDSERLPPRHDLSDGMDSSRDDIDSISEWYRTPRIPEEPDCCDIMSKDFILSRRGASVQHSRTSSIGASSGSVDEGYLAMAPGPEPPLAVSASSGSICSGTPSTDPRFSEYQLEPATAHISEERSARAYSVGSRPGGARSEPARLRAYSAGARRRPPPAAAAACSAPAAPHHPLHPLHPHSHHPHAPRPSAGDFLELDFSANSPAPKVIIPRTPPTVGFVESRRNTDEYVDMSPRNAGYVEMRPGEPPATPHPPAATPDGYVEMSYGRPATGAAPPCPSPADAHEAPQGAQGAQGPHHALSTVREISEDGRRSPDAAPPRSPSPPRSPPNSPSPSPSPAPSPDQRDEPKSKPIDAPEVREPNSAAAGSPGGALHYAALDLEPRRAPAASAPRLYTQIDFLRSEKLQPHAT